MYFELLRETLNTSRNMTIQALSNGTAPKANNTVVSPTTKQTKTGAKRRNLQITIPKVNITGQPTSNTTKPNTTNTSTNTTRPTNNTNATANTSSNSTRPNTTNSTSNGTNSTTRPNQTTPTPPPSVQTPAPPSPRPNVTNTTTNQSTAPPFSFLNQNQFKLLYWMQFRFLQDAFRALVNTLNSSTNTEFETTINTKMAVFIVFVILTCLTYLIFWTPFLSKLNRDVSPNHSLLSCPLAQALPHALLFYRSNAPNSCSPSSPYQSS